MVMASGWRESAVEISARSLALMSGVRAASAESQRKERLSMVRRMLKRLVGMEQGAGSVREQAENGLEELPSVKLFKGMLPRQQPIGERRSLKTLAHAGVQPEDKVAHAIACSCVGLKFEVTEVTSFISVCMQYPLLLGSFVHRNFRAAMLSMVDLLESGERIGSNEVI